MSTLVAQISDIHAKPESASLRALDRALHYLDSVRPDAVIVSGDVSNKPHEKGYALVREKLAALRCPVYAVPGNADRREEMRACLDATDWPAEGSLHVNATVRDAMRLIGLDVTVPGEKHGEITDDVMAFLRGALVSTPRLPALIFMHQHPFPTHSAALDRLMCRNVEPLRAAIAASPVPVLALVCGHAHRAITTRFAGVPAIMCPSLETANPALADGHGEPPVTDPPGLMLHAIEGASLVSHTVSLGQAKGS